MGRVCKCEKNYRRQSLHNPQMVFVLIMENILMCVRACICCGALFWKLQRSVEKKSDLFFFICAFSSVLIASCAQLFYIHGTRRDAKSIYIFGLHMAKPVEITTMVTGVRIPVLENAVLLQDAYMRGKKLFIGGHSNASDYKSYYTFPNNIYINERCCY